MGTRMPPGRRGLNTGIMPVTGGCRWLSSARARVLGETRRASRIPATPGEDYRVRTPPTCLCMLLPCVTAVCYCRVLLPCVTAACYCRVRGSRGGGGGGVERGRLGVVVRDAPPLVVCASVVAGRSCCEGAGL